MRTPINLSTIVCLLLIAVPMALAPNASAQVEDPDPDSDWPEAYMDNWSDPRCADFFWDPEYFYCHHSFWGFEHEYRIAAVEVLDTGGWGFSMYAESAPGETNATATALFENDLVTLSGDVDGAEFEIEFLWTCYYWYYYDSLYPCGFWTEGVQLGDGWVLDQGIDLSGLWIPSANGDSPSPAFAYGNGALLPWYPWSDITEPPFRWSHEGTPVYDFPLGDFFGITVRIHTGEHDSGPIPVPEPRLALALPIGLLALGHLARRRRGAAVRADS